MKSKINIQTDLFWLTIAELHVGDFIRVRADHTNEARAKMDGMAIQDMGDQVALVFWSDRYGHFQDCECVAPELWDKSELDFETLDKAELSRQLNQVI